MVRKIYSKIQPVSCTNIHHDVTDLVHQGMIKNIKTWITWEWSITFLRNKKILYPCLTWHILRSYRFDADVTFKVLALKVEINLLNQHFKPYEWLAGWLTNYLLRHFSFQGTQSTQTSESHKAFGHSSTWDIRRTLGHSGNQGTQVTQGTRKTLRHSNGT